MNLKTKLLDKIKKAKDEIKFFQENDTCPTCDQQITDNVKRGHVEKGSSKVLEIETALLEVDTRAPQGVHQYAWGISHRFSS